MNITMEITERDKKLLLFMAFFVIVLGFGFFVIRPLSQADAELKIELENQQELMMETQQKLVMLPAMESSLVKTQEELEEAARVDGSSDLGIFLKIILPLSKPTIASVSLFYAVGHWNSYFSAMLYISDKSKEVVQIALRRIIFLAGGINTDGTPIDWGMMGQPPEKAVKMATTVVATVPILLIYPFVQKYFTQGVMVGAVKG